MRLKWGLLLGLLQLQQRILIQLQWDSSIWEAASGFFSQVGGGPLWLPLAVGDPRSAGDAFAAREPLGAYHWG